MRASTSFTCVMASLCFVATATGTTINVQFEPTFNGTAYAGTGAAPDLGTTWNQVSVSAGTAPGPTTLTNLSNSQGVATTVGMSVSGYNNVGTDPVNGNALLTDYIFTNNSEPSNTSTGSFTISGLGGGKYDLYLYAMIGSPNLYPSTFTTSAGSQSTTLSATTSATASTIPTSDLGKSYVLFSGLSPVSGSISGTWTDTGTGLGGFNGFQLVAAAVPEPTSCVLFGMGALGLFVAAGRRRRS